MSISENIALLEAIAVAKEVTRDAAVKTRLEDAHETLVAAVVDEIEFAVVGAVVNRRR